MTTTSATHKGEKASSSSTSSKKASRKEKTTSSSSAMSISTSSAHSHPQHAAPPASPLFTTPTPSVTNTQLAHLPRYLHPLHRCRFQTFLPSSIISLAFSPSGSKLAIGRANGNIELWSLSYNPPGSGAGTAGWVLMKTIPGSGEATVQVLKWTRGLRASAERLFSAGLNGRLIEWDLTTLAPKYASDTYGGAVWCGDVFQTSEVSSNEGSTVMALGCEDGTIRLFDLSDPTQSPLYIKSISRHTSRILSISYSPDGAFLVTGGSEGMIKVWEVKEGRNIQRITVENKGLKRTTVASANSKKSDSDERYVTYIWSVQFLTDSTIMSGDSLGNIQIWDLEFGTLKQSFPKALQGDILSLVVNKNRTVAYAAGVEGKIVELKSVNAGNISLDSMQDGQQSAADNKWVLTANHRHHTHDVYALAISPVTLPPSLASKQQQQQPSSASATTFTSTNNYLLVSGGVDTQLLLSPTINFPDYPSISRLLPFPQNKTNIVIADKCSPPRFLVSHEQHLQLYGLGSINYDETMEQLRTKELFLKETENIKVEKGYVHLLDINVNSRKTADTSNPAVSVWIPGGGLNLICSSISPNSTYIACSDPIQVKLYHIQNKEGSTNPNALVVKKVQVNHLINPASSLVFSADSSKLFVATLGGSIQILDLESLQVASLDEHVPQPTYEGDLSSDEDEDEPMDGSSSTKKKSTPISQQLGLIRTIAVSHDQQYLAIGDEFNHIWIYNLDSMSLHATLPIFNQTHLTFQFHPQNSSLLAILCAKNVLYLYDVEHQCLTDYTKKYLQTLTSTSSQTAAALQRDQFIHLSFDSSALTNSNSLILQSINQLLFINLDKPKPKEGVVLPNLNPSSQKEALNRRDRKRKLAEEAAAAAGGLPPSSSTQGEDELLDPLQTNFRLITRFRPMLFGGFIDESHGNVELINKNKATLKQIAQENAANNGSGTNDKKKRKKAAEEDASSAQPEFPVGVDVSLDPNASRPVLIGSSLLVIEAPWLNILQQLPQPMARHRYGT